MKAGQMYGILGFLIVLYAGYVWHRALFCARELEKMAENWDCSVLSRKEMLVSLQAILYVVFIFVTLKLHLMASLWNAEKLFIGAIGWKLYDLGVLMLMNFVICCVKRHIKFLRTNGSLHLCKLKLKGE